MAEARHIKFIALAHDGKLLASHLHWDKDPTSTDNYEDVTRTIFDSPGWATVREQRKNKLELKSGANTYCMEIDPEGRVFVVVITRAYPVRHVFSSASAASATPKLMKEFSDYVVRNYPEESRASAPGSLKRTLRPFLRDLAVRFDDLDSIDKVVAVHKKLDGLQTTMMNTLKAADERQGLLEKSDGRTTEFHQGAKQMFQRSRSMHRRACLARWNLCCVILLLILLILLLIGGIVLGLNYSKYHWF